MPDWSDRDAVAELAAGGAEILGDDPAAARAAAERKWDRTPGTVAATRSFLSATAKRSHARSRVRGCSYSNGLDVDPRCGRR